MLKKYKNYFSFKFFKNIMTNKLYLDLKKIFSNYLIVSDIDNLLSWDTSTLLPKNSLSARLKQIEYLKKLKYEILTSNKVKDLFLNIEIEKLNFMDKKNFYKMKKDYDYLNFLPEKLLQKKSKVSSECEVLWVNARKEKKFKIVEKKFDELLKIIREEGNILSDNLNLSVYDSFLFQYDESFKDHEINNIFSQLRPFLTSLRNKVIKKQKNEKYLCIKNHLNKNEQYSLSLFFMKKFGFDFNKGRLDISPHPFCGGSSEDIRITTNYNNFESFNSFEAVMHETGHALYEFGLPKKLKNQLIGKSGGMALHESQSLFLEMQIVRSIEFKQYLSKIIKKKFNKKGDEWSAKNLFKLGTKIINKPIRIETDEVSYPLHIILRYEIEKKLINNEIKTNELPELWNVMFDEIFNFKVRSASEGCLQDIHWYCGLFGYFPSYSLGASIATQFSFAINKEIKSFKEKVSNGNFKELLKWLKNNVHTKASLFNTKEILFKATNENINIEYFKNHLVQRYLN